MHGVGGQAPRTEGRPEYKKEAAEEVIGGQEQETPDDRDIKLFFALDLDLVTHEQQPFRLTEQQGWRPHYKKCVD
jgi:hypothetical protein